MPVEFLTDEQAARYGRFVEVPSRAELLVCTERHTRVIDAFIALANAVIITRRLIRTAWTTHRWDTRPTRRP